jgi:hypothetical protein
MAEGTRVAVRTHDPVLVDAIIHESEQVQSGIDRAQNGIYTSFGVVLPAVFGLFLFFAGDKRPEDTDIPPNIAALLFVMAVSLGGMWSQNLWMELFRYTRYKHAVLLPRLYQATGQSSRTNFLQTVPRTALMQLPVNLFNLGCLVALIGVHVKFIGRTWPVAAISIAFILAVVVSTIAVIVEGIRLGKAVHDAVKRGPDGPAPDRTATDVWQ